MTLQCLVQISRFMFIINPLEVYALFSVFVPTLFDFLRTHEARLCSTSNNRLCYVIREEGDMYLLCSPL
jgi:hypothetical protein